MRTRSAIPPKSDSVKKTTPKKGATKTPTKSEASDTAAESPLSAETEALKVSPTKSEAEEKMQDEEAKEMKGDAVAVTATEKNATPAAKASTGAKAKVATVSKTKSPEAAKPKTVDELKLKTTAKDGTKVQGKVDQNEAKVAKTGVKSVVQKGREKVEDPPKVKEQPSTVESSEKGGDIKVEIAIEAQDKPAEAIANDEEFEEGDEDELEPEDADEEEGGEAEEYVSGEEYEEGGEGEEGGDEEDLGEDEEEGDEEEEHQEIEIPADVKERKRKKELEVFVGGLDKDAVEEDLKKVFEQVGEVVEIRLLRNPLTNKNKGFAFIGFATKEQAKRAVAELKNPMVRGKRCGVAPSEDNDTLFLGNICKTWTKEAVKEKVKEYGVDGLEELTLVGDTQNEGLSRGFAFLEFSTHLDAMNAYKRLQRPDVVFGADRTAKVAFAEPLHEPDEEVMAQVKSVFVDGLPPFWDENRVKEHLKKYGEIERVALARNMATAKRRDFGFVNFTTHDAAIACIEGLNNTVLVDGETKLKVKVRLANPLPKSQAVKGGMRGGFPIGRSGFGVRVAGWKPGVGRYPFKKVGFPRGRGFIPRGRGRGFIGRGGKNFYRDDDDVNNLFREFHEGITYDERRTFFGRGRGMRPFGGFRRGSYRGFPRPGVNFSTRATVGARQDAYKENFGSRRGSFVRGGPRLAQARRHSFPPSEDLYGRNLGQTHFRRDSFGYDDGSHGAKRPYSALGEDPRYIEPVGRGHARARYDYPDTIPAGARYPDSLGTGGGLYSSGYTGASDYYGTDVGREKKIKYKATLALCINFLQDVPRSRVQEGATSCEF